MMAERLNLTVDDGIGEKLAQLAGSRNKMGEAVSNLVRAAREVEDVPAASEMETLRLMVLGLSAEIKQMKRKLSYAHKQLQLETRYNQERISDLMKALGVDEETRINILDQSFDYAVEAYGGLTDPFTGEREFGLSSR